ncbi:TlpA family protein disulfide reductase [Campylobacter sp. VicNov18]|uniref:TlpA family protein disulfide reductase n=1 Tax=Campylobacter bilis TaxID=2691918 RepID=UPI00130EDA77|nr:TlpA disulfide reductase family protein [Campylobacter bilis]MPV63169.1 redoxin family protein [Campylobacter hepaticus]MBM0636669.1 redoxin family protein [Campylobacter bilis]MCC8277513.1 TlpA family protein disulfide reductase [Campylobacter bilis]MCC8298718.1 TlpA family protein disulfide reductase [Campylobacter bilis]MCC8300422.1 TlpA family protein disulfide reductase [Campylobacter bilis]
MKIKKIFSLMIIVYLLVACSNEKTKQQSDANATIDSSLSQSDEMKFSLNLTDGGTFFIKKENSVLNFDNKNKAILFVFFTTWCTPCIAEVPHLNKMQEKYKNDFSIIGVLLEDKTNDEINQFIKQHKIVYKIANGENNYLLVKALGKVNGIPTMFLYNKHAKLINQYLGLIPEEMLEIDIQKAVF